jgi:hypothetical protein
MTPDMLVTVEEEAKKHDMSRAEYVRHLIRQAHDSPFDEPDTTLCKDENGRPEKPSEGAA